MNTTAAAPTIHTNQIVTRPADARTILQQIGTRYALPLIGARNIVDLGDGVHFNISRRNCKVVVKLAANDTYAVEVVKINRRDLTWSSEFYMDTVYADMLQDVVLQAAGVEVR